MAHTKRTGHPVVPPTKTEPEAPLDPTLASEIETPRAQPEPETEAEAEARETYEVLQEVNVRRRTQVMPSSWENLSESERNEWIDNPHLAYKKAQRLAARFQEEFDRPPGHVIYERWRTRQHSIT